ncbi:MAG: hypothetical protein ACYCZF_17400, partial [Anaerolineae bacterium]
LGAARSHTAQIHLPTCYALTLGHISRKGAATIPATSISRSPRCAHICRPSTRNRAGCPLLGAARSHAAQVYLPTCNIDIPFTTLRPY